MSIPHGTTGNAHSKRYQVKGDGRPDDFGEMIRVKNDKHDGYAPPLVSADYWEVMPAIEARLEQARVERAETERQENYSRAVNAQNLIREAQDALPPEVAGRMKRKPTDSAKIDALEPAMEELYSRGMSYRQIGAALGVHATTVQKRLEKRGVV